jgi:hypothetical protein
MPHGHNYDQQDEERSTAEGLRPRIAEHQFDENLEYQAYLAERDNERLREKQELLWEKIGQQMNPNTGPSLRSRMLAKQRNSKLPNNNVPPTA